jgi:hypothetical protein
VKPAGQAQSGKWRIPLFYQSLEMVIDAIISLFLVAKEQIQIPWKWAEIVTLKVA